MGIVLGQRVKCRVTGVEGIATIRMCSAGRFDQIHIQPRSNDNSKVEDGILTDEVNCLVLDDGISKDRIEPNTIEFNFGDHVIDPYSMMKGTVTQLMISFNGCVEIAVQPPYTDKWARAIMIPDTRLMHIEDFNAEMQSLRQERGQEQAQIQGPEAAQAKEPEPAMAATATQQTPPTAPAPGFLRRTADRLTGAHHGRASFLRG